MTLLQSNLETECLVLPEGIESISWQHSAPYRTINGLPHIRVENQSFFDDLAIQGRATLLFTDSRWLGVRYESDIELRGIITPSGLTVFPTGFRSLFVTDSFPGVVYLEGEKDYEIPCFAATALLAAHLVGKMGRLYRTDMNSLDIR